MKLPFSIQLFRTAAHGQSLPASQISIFNLCSLYSVLGELQTATFHYQLVFYLHWPASRHLAVPFEAVELATLWSCQHLGMSCLSCEQSHQTQTVLPMCLQHQSLGLPFDSNLQIKAHSPSPRIALRFPPSLSEEPKLFQLHAAALVLSDFNWGGGRKKAEVPLGLQRKWEETH